MNILFSVPSLWPLWIHSCPQSCTVHCSFCDGGKSGLSYLCVVCVCVCVCVCIRGRTCVCKLRCSCLHFEIILPIIDQVLTSSIQASEMLKL